MNQQQWDLQIIGMTNQQEAWVGSKERKFRINEFLIVEDAQGELVGEIIQVNTYNRYLPMDMNSEFPDLKTMDNMARLGFDLNEDTVYLGKVRLLQEANYPLEVGSTLRIPTFDEVRSYFLPEHWQRGLKMGVIRNTHDIYDTMDEELKGRVSVFEKNQLYLPEEVPYFYDLYHMHQYPHIGIFGGSGSGKSFGLRVMLEELMHQGIPTLVLDPHYEMDFSDAFRDQPNDFQQRFRRFTVGREVGVRFMELTATELKQLLNTSGHLTESMDNVVDTLHRKNMTYEQFEGVLNDLIQGAELGKEGIEAEIRQAEDEEAREIWRRILQHHKQYGDRCPQASVTGVNWRLARLKSSGIFSNGIESVVQTIREGKLAVLQGSTRMIQVFSTYLVNHLYEKRRAYKDVLVDAKDKEYFPPFIVVTDEAHNFAPQTKDGQRDIPSRQVLREIAQEGRKYGVFLILATQRPSLLDNTITAQLNAKFIFRTTRATDIDTIRDETDLSPEEAKRLPYLQTGDVFVSEASVGRTIYIRIRAALTQSPHTENPFDEWRVERNRGQVDFAKLVEAYLPIKDTDLDYICAQIEKKHGKTIRFEDFRSALDDMVRAGYLTLTQGMFANEYRRAEE